MKQFSIAVNKIEDGILHVRSAGLIMKEASQFASDVKVTKDEKTVNGKGQSMARIFWNGWD